MREGWVLLQHYSLATTHKTPRNACLSASSCKHHHHHYNNSNNNNNNTVKFLLRGIATSLVERTALDIFNRDSLASVSYTHLTLPTTAEV